MSDTLDKARAAAKRLKVFPLPSVVLLPGNLFQLIINTQVLEGVVTPITLVFLLILANRRTLLGAAANGRLARTVGLITVVVVGSFASFLVLLTVAGWLGIST